MKNRDKTPSIYEYNDFRQYLADYQMARMRYESSFTKSEFSRMLQLPNTRSYFNDVLKSKRVSETFVERFIQVIGFKREEAQFFRTLVHFNQAQNPQEREFFFEQLIDLNRTPNRVIDSDLLLFYNKWYNSVIRALLEIEDISDNYELLAKKINPPVTPSQVKKAVTLLLRLGLVSRNDSGVLKPVDKAIQASEKIKDELIRQHQLQCLTLAQKAMLNGSDSVPFSFINTLSISEQGHKRLMRLLDKFQSQVRSLVHKDEGKPDRVLQLNIVLNKVTK